DMKHFPCGNAFSRPTVISAWTGFSSSVAFRPRAGWQGREGQHLREDLEHQRVGHPPLVAADRGHLDRQQPGGDGSAPGAKAGPRVLVPVPGKLNPLLGGYVIELPGDADTPDLAVWMDFLIGRDDHQGRTLGLRPCGSSTSAWMMRPRQGVDM